MIRPMIWRALALAVFAAGAPSAHAAEVYQVSTISSLLAGGYDGDTTVAELLRHGGFGLGTFNGVDGEMMVLDGRVYRGTVDGHTHAVADSALTPFAVVVAFRPQGSAPVAAGQSLEQLEAALDALPYSASRVLAARVDGRFRTIAVRSEPKQQPPYRPLPEVIKEQQVVHTFDDVDGTLIGFRFPATTTSVNVPGWHFHFISADRGRGGHVLGLTNRRGPGLARGILRPAHQLARPSPGIERRRGGDQGGGTPAVSFSARARPRRTA